ncbi:MauE/DoxX family redox-associated membrane protein [Chitinophaga hostae]|uniref:MauE/DoxX family redox-associated membrane protein n=1 Tax=Chitinophaga hostae TaxID=2831022 RepID=UPI003F6A4BE9
MNFNKTYDTVFAINRKWKLLADCAAGVLICLFLYTGIDKLYHQSQFKDALQKSPVLSGYATLLAWSLPTSELFIALLLFMPQTRRYGFKASVLLLSAFTLYLGYMMVFAPKLPCMCAGLLESLSWRMHLVLNVVLIVIAILGLVMGGKRYNDGTRAPPVGQG